MTRTSTVVDLMAKQLPESPLDEELNELNSLLTTLHLESSDLDSLLDSGKGKHREGTLPLKDDEEYAFTLYREELQAQEICFQDLAFVRGLEAAVHTHAEIVEDTARTLADQEFAQRLAGMAPTSTVASSRPRSPLVASTSGTSMASSFGGSTVAPSPTSTGATTPTSLTAVINQPIHGLPMVTCTVCGDQVREDATIKIPCGHIYGANCLLELFQHACRDETLMPPRCCREPISLDLIRSDMSTDQINLFLSKQQEYTTLNRLYCPSHRCSKFLGPATSESEPTSVHCRSCGTDACASCKGYAHPSQPCPTTEEDESLLAIARQEGWARCPTCHRFVELREGCFHMTCRCGGEFCYLCASRWKTCDCRQWDEDRLYARARQQVNVAAEAHGARHVDPAVRVREVQRVAENLRVDHECRHAGRWRYRNGGGQCESCFRNPREYLYRCPRCQMLACRQCVNNRL